MTVRSSILKAVGGYLVLGRHLPLTADSLAAEKRRSAIYRQMADEIDWEGLTIHMQDERFEVLSIQNVRLRRHERRDWVIELHGLLERSVRWAGHKHHHVVRPATTRVQRSAAGMWVQVSTTATIECYEAESARRRELVPLSTERRRRIPKADLDAFGPF